MTLESDIDSIVELGFSRERALEALKKFNQDVNRGVDWLCNSEQNKTTIAAAAAAATVNLTSSADENLEKVLRESREENERKEMQAAIKESLNTTNEVQQKQIKKAIEQSLASQLQETTFMENANPYDRLKMGKMHSGLKNIGNTCYVNSVLQSYFHLKPFITNLFYVIIEDPWLQIESIDNGSSLLFIKELQYLFASMLLGIKKYQDPTPVLKTLLQSSHHVFTIGNQADISEFNHVLLQNIENAVKMVRELASKQSLPMPNFDIRKLFYGTLHIDVWGQEADQSNFRFTNIEQFSPIFIGVENHANLYESLDAYTSISNIENFITSKGHKTSLQKEVWFESLPSVLVFQLQRVKYNRDSNIAVKIHDPFSFDSVIYMDRYIYSNREKVKGKREKHDFTRKTLKERRDFIAKFGKNYNGTGQAVHLLLQDACEHMKSKGSSLDTTVFEHIKKCASNIESELEKYSNEIGKLEQIIVGLYEEIDFKRRPYRLHSILVHEGQAGEGHYWSFVFDMKKNCWIKFNDSLVSEVKESTVWKESFGGYHNTSAYCLTYVDCILDIDKLDVELCLSPSLREQVEQDNALFEHELASWQKNSLKMEIDTNVSITDRNMIIAEKIDELEMKMIADFDKHRHKADYDVRLESFEMFLCSMNRIKLLHHFLSKSVLQASNIPLSDEILHVLNLDLEDQISIDELWTLYHKFLEATKYLLAGLEHLLNTKDYHVALEYLLESYKLDRRVLPASMRREVEILSYIIYFLKSLSEHAKQQIEVSAYRTLGLRFGKTIAEISTILPVSNMTLDTQCISMLKEDWILIAERLQNDRSLTEEQRTLLQEIATIFTSSSPEPTKHCRLELPKSSMNTQILATIYHDLTVKVKSVFNKVDDGPCHGL